MCLFFWGAFFALSLTFFRTESVTKELLGGLKKVPFWPFCGQFNASFDTLTQFDVQVLKKQQKLPKRDMIKIETFGYLFSSLEYLEYN